MLTCLCHWVWDCRVHWPRISKHKKLDVVYSNLSKLFLHPVLQNADQKSIKISFLKCLWPFDIQLIYKPTVSSRIFMSSDVLKTGLLRSSLSDHEAHHYQYLPVCKKIPGVPLPLKNVEEQTITFYCLWLFFLSTSLLLFWPQD